MNETTFEVQPPTPNYAPPKPKRVLWKWSLLASAVFLAFLMWQCGSALYHGRTLANGSVRAFHKAVDEERYEEICQNGVEGFHEGKNHDEMVRLLKLVHSRLGNAGAEELQKLNINSTASGTFLTGDYETTFQQGSAEESFVWRKVNGELKLYSYHITSNTLVFGNDDRKSDVR